jgi:uncharacterized protein YfaS (alpha-2-macroglobulin family)
MRNLTLFVGLVASSAVQAKPLYITVPRAYGTQEPAVVDVAFAGTQPVELRVLRPKDLDAFIGEQANIRRAYTEPTSIVNPGRYLSRGMNALGNPAEYLLQMMDGEFRGDLADSLPDRQRTKSPRVSELAQGPEKLISIPNGMEMVRSEWLNLDLGGPDRGFDVPGFTGFGYHRSGFQERRVALEPLPAGVYVLQMVQDRVEGQVTLVVTDLTVQLKQTDGEVLVRVAGRNQRPIEGAEVKIHLGRKKNLAGQTNRKGEVRFETDEPRLLATITHEGDTALVDTDFYSTLAIAPDVFIYGDRPIYKPGDRVRFRGLVRKPASFLAQLFSPMRRKVTVRLENREGLDVSTRSSIDEFGSFSGVLRIPEELETGVVQLVANINERDYQSEARVQAYVKPTFYLEMTTDQDSASPGDTITTKVRARRYAGGVPDGARYEVFLYRSLLTTPQWVDDAGMGGEGSAVTYGSVSTTEGTLSVPVRLYSSTEERANNDSSFDYYDPWASAPTFDAQGEATINLRVPELSEEEKKSRTPFKYLLTVRAQDQEMSKASISRPFFFADCDVIGQLSSNKGFVTVGGDAVFSVRAVTLGGRPFGVTQGQVAFLLRDADGGESVIETQTIETGKDGVWRHAWPTSRIGTLLARVELQDQRARTWSGESRILVIGNHGEAVAPVPILQAQALPEPLAPGDVARLVALFPDRWGPGGQNGGPVWITYSGNTLYETRLLQAKGLSLVHEFPIERRFGSAVYVSIAYPTASGRWDERTVAYRIIPRERALTVRLVPEQQEAKPLGQQTLRLRVTNHRGEGVKAQVSVGVVDKAVYAIQEEFRPHVLGFFYPLVRNNVANFYSAEFQGYGYGEYLARLRGRFRAHEFAAVKPPEIERKDEDTAYWNSAVLTDSTGSASVTFKLPHNQTLWVATAVAADAAGRFGEGTAEFASRGKLNIASSLPQFLRERDTATATIRIANTRGKKPRTVSVAVASSHGLEGSGEFNDVSIAAKGEEVLPFSLTAQKTGLARVALRLETEEDSRTDQRVVAVRPAAISEKVMVSRAGSGTLQLELPSQVAVKNVELNLMPSSVAATLASVRDMLTYPYGCLEQLVATTIPNVAAYSTLKRVGAFGELDPESQALLEEAHSRSIHGLNRIFNLSLQSGGFTWFGGANEPTVPLTLIAIDGLTYAIEAGLVNRNDPRLAAGAAYLARQDRLPPVLDATRTYVLARLEGNRQAPRVRALLENASGGDMYSAALSVLAAEHAGIMGEPEVQERIIRLANQANANIAKTAGYEYGDAFWRFPLGQVGLTAILTHAASFGNVDQEAARHRFVNALAASDLSTFNRSTLLLHNLWLLEADAQAMRQMEAPAVTGHGGGAVELKPRGTGLTAALPPDATRVHLGSFVGVATLSATVLTPLDQVEAREEGMSIERSYWLLRPDGRQLLTDPVSVSQGQHVFVQLDIDAHDGGESRAMRSAYYVVEDPLPAGFEPVYEDKPFRSKPYDLPLAHEAMRYRSLNPERAVFFFDEPTWWSRSPREIGYVMRAQFAGEFSVPPAKVSDMYAASLFAQTEASQLSITASE